MATVPANFPYAECLINSGCTPNGFNYVISIVPAYDCNCRTRGARLRAPANREENTVKQDTLSLRRRRLMIAGLVGIATPAGVFAAQFSPAASAGSADAPDATLVISGRVLGPDGKPLAGAAIDALPAAGNRPHVSATTDADGHPQATGYGVIAQEVAAAVRRLFPKK